MNPASAVGSTTAANPYGLETTTKKQEAIESKDSFLKLLVAQIKNQDPLNPADGVEFLTQLAQFSQLEQSMGIREEISGLRTQVETITDALAKTTGEGNNV